MISYHKGYQHVTKITSFDANELGHQKSQKNYNTDGAINAIRTHLVTLLPRVGHEVSCFSVGEVVASHHWSYEGL